MPRNGQAGDERRLEPEWRKGRGKIGPARLVVCPIGMPHKSHLILIRTDVAAEIENVCPPIYPRWPPRRRCR